MRGAIPTLPLYLFMARCLVKHRDNFTFTFTDVGWNRDISVGIALGYGLDDRGSRVRFPAGVGNYSLHHRVRTAVGPTQPRIQWAFFLGVKRPGSEADHSPPSSAEVKNAWSFTTTPPMSSWRGA
jgi:hypothetical protein